MFTQNSNDNSNIDLMPSTSSAKSKKKRKRNSQDEKSSLTSNVNTGALVAGSSSCLAAGKRLQPTSTITSHEMLMQQQPHLLLQQSNELASTNALEFSFHHHPNQMHSTSSTFMAGPSNGSALPSTSSSTAATAASNSGTPFMQQQQMPTPQEQQQKLRTKIYECTHCDAKYSKLKDRNAHMIDVHNYVRQNRKLVCITTATSIVTNADLNGCLPTTSAAAAASNSILLTQTSIEEMGDYKQAIVKIEQDNREFTAAMEPIQATLNAKTEPDMEDDKKSLTLLAAHTTAENSGELESDTKPPTTNTQPLAFSAPTSKLTSLYRMLITFNMTTLKQNKMLSEFDENLIQSSIFFCYVCRQNFNSVKLYDAHLTEHAAECFTCGKKFQRWKNFSLHLKRHLGWKEFGCNVCDKKFVVRSALVEHMRMHSGYSPLKCKICGKY